MEEVLKKVLKKITPDREEIKKIEEVSKDILSKLKSNDAEVVLGGSASRGTFLKGNHDLDFFVRFKSEEDIKRLFKPLVLSKFKNAKVVHGTRDYFRFNYKGFKVEIVPSVKRSSPDKAKNSADISYFHISYLKKRITKDMIKEILLLKQFLKANDIYGAESARGGFSGYVCELLIIHFKTFSNLIKFMDSSKPKIIIDIEGHYKSNKEVMKKLDRNKTKGPLIIIDPQLPLRNAAACVSYESFSQFLFRLRCFLRNPDERLFNIRGIKLKLIKERSKRRGTKLIYFRIRKSDKEFDIVKAKAMRKLKMLAAMLRKEGWNIYNYGVSDDGFLFVELESLKVSKAKRHYGPIVWADAKAFEKFMDKWNRAGIGKPYVFRNRIVVDVERKQRIKEEIKKFMNDFL